MELSTYEPRVKDLGIDRYVFLMRAGRLPEQEFPATRALALETAMTLRFAAGESGSDIVKHVIEDLANGLQRNVITGTHPAEPYLLGPALALGGYLHEPQIRFDELARRLDTRLETRALTLLRAWP